MKPPGPMMPQVTPEHNEKNWLCSGVSGPFELYSVATFF